MKDNTKSLLKLIRRYESIKEQFVDGYEEFSILRDEVRENKFNTEELVNRIYVLRECAKYLEDLRKETEGVVNIMEQMCCALYLIQHANSPEKADPIRAPFATGTPKTMMRAKLPKLHEDPERYTQLLDHFGVSPDQAVKQVLRPHWPSMCQYLTDLAEQGMPVPAGIKPGETYPVYSVIIRVRRSLELILDELEDLEDPTNEEKIEEVLTKKVQ